MYFVTQFEMKDIHVMGYDSIPGTTRRCCCCCAELQQQHLSHRSHIAVGVIDTVEN